MDKDIYITMLGVPQAGKTCYMLAMYNTMRGGIKGFTLAHQDPDEDLRLFERWEQLESGRGDGKSRWPLPTTEDESTSYKFDFCFAYEKLIGFDWLDYGGEALKKLKEAKDSQELTGRLLKSSCIFLCLSGEYLANEVINSTLKTSMLTDRMNVLMRDVGKTGKRIPIVIMITQFDLCASKFGERAKEKILEHVHKLFSPLLGKGGKWTVMVCPVTLGSELANNSETGLIDPRQVHLPLIFAVHWEYYQETLRKKEQLKKALQTDNRTTWEKIIGKPVSREEAKRCEKELTELSSKLKLLTDELNTTGIVIYIDGEELKGDVDDN